MSGVDDLMAWLRGVLDGEEASFSQAVKEGRFSINRYRRNMADVEAKRAILDAHVLAEKHTEFGADEWQIGRADGLRSVVRLLASAYADRPGYREEWPW